MNLPMYWDVQLGNVRSVVSVVLRVFSAIIFCVLLPGASILPVLADSPSMTRPTLVVPFYPRQTTLPFTDRRHALLDNAAQARS